MMKSFLSDLDMKFIDAERLRKEIKRLEKAAHRSALGCADSETRKFHEGKDFAYQHVGVLLANGTLRTLPVTSTNSAKTVNDMDKIHQKIKELRELLEDHNYYLDNSEQALGYGAALDDIEKFLDTLSEEPDKSLEEEYKDYVENDPVYSKLVNRNAGLVIARHFAEWQKSQMLKDAVKGEVYKFGEVSYVKERNNAELTKYLSQFNNGDKVRIVVLKAEEE